MSHTICLLRSLEQHIGPRPINSLQRVYAQAILCVAVIEGDGDLLSILMFTPIVEQFTNGGNGHAIGWSVDTFLAPRLGERDVVCQAQAIPALQRPDLMLTIGVERGITQLVPRGSARKLDLVLSAVMKHDQLAAFTNRR